MRKDTVLIGKGACSSVFLRNMPNGLNTDAVPLALRGTEYSVRFFDFSVARIFDLHQKQPLCMHHKH